MPLTKSSTHGWMMTANTCAPPRPKDRRHLETEVKGIMNIESEAYQKSDAPWQTTSSSAFRGFDNATMRKAKLPTTMDPAQPNQTFLTTRRVPAPNALQCLTRLSSSTGSHLATS